MSEKEMAEAVKSAMPDSPSLAAMWQELKKQLSLLRLLKDGWQKLSPAKKPLFRLKFPNLLKALA